MEERKERAKADRTFLIWQAAAAKVKALKGSRSLKLLQQYGLVLATYNEAPPDQTLHDDA